jgi:hypothetical protein
LIVSVVIDFDAKKFQIPRGTYGRWRMRFGKLRIPFSAVCGIVCVLLIGLWVRSYWVGDAISWDQLPEQVAIISAVGGISYAEFANPAGDGDGSWRIYSQPIDPETKHRAIILRFQWIRDVYDLHVIVPYWFPVLLAAAIGAAPWVRWSRGFSLRTLLIAATVVALVLGAAIYGAK